MYFTRCLDVDLVYCGVAHTFFSPQKQLNIYEICGRSDLVCPGLSNKTEVSSVTPLLLLVVVAIVLLMCPRHIKNKATIYVALGCTWARISHCHLQDYQAVHPGT